MCSTTSHFGTAILLNDGKTAYVYDLGYFICEDLLGSLFVAHVDISDFDRATATSCEILNDGECIDIFNNGIYHIYNSIIDGMVSCIDFIEDFDGEVRAFDRFSRGENYWTYAYIPSWLIEDE